MFDCIGLLDHKGVGSEKKYRISVERVCVSFMQFISFNIWTSQCGNTPLVQNFETMRNVETFRDGQT